ncbi:DinB family protein [Chondromyces crocatus]|uniref:DinB-like domain-containing protein n=1 Tax=Chondromyces crocatus TaxID=52 RepID=A0A0K1ERE3_CHOCO|nr:DinB family protein [Chondromyces crocatus]AKT43500.1 uncharacterized protein CMC5_077320 [Chondromyces crocatus]
MANDVRDCLLRQLDIAWALTSYHLETLTTEECLWRPAHAGLHVTQLPEGTWRADWPDREGYDLGPSSIAWLTWHLGFWWSMVLDHSFGEGKLAREDILWPGNADDLRAWIGRLQSRWREAIEPLTDDDLRSPDRTRWPFQERPFADVIAWASVELTKSAAEIGYARFLHGVKR